MNEFPSIDPGVPEWMVGREAEFAGIASDEARRGRVDEHELHSLSWERCLTSGRTSVSNPGGYFRSACRTALVDMGRSDLKAHGERVRPDRDIADALGRQGANQDLIELAKMAWRLRRVDGPVSPRDLVAAMGGDPTDDDAVREVQEHLVWAVRLIAEVNPSLATDFERRTGWVSLDAQRPGEDGPAFELVAADGVEAVALEMVGRQAFLRRLIDEDSATIVAAIGDLFDDEVADRAAAMPERRLRQLVQEYREAIDPAGADRSQPGAA